MSRIAFSSTLLIAAATTVAPAKAYAAVAQGQSGDREVAAAFSAPIIGQATPGSSLGFEVEGIDRRAVQWAGVYRMMDGEWKLDQSAQRRAGPADLVYTNTASISAYYTGIGPTGSRSGGTLVDAAGIPGLTNPTPFVGVVDREQTMITQLEFAYCDLNSGQGTDSGWDLAIYDSYSECSDPNVPPIAILPLRCLPNDGCWIVTVSLADCPFCLQGDGGSSAPGFDDDDAFDSFGYSLRYAGTAPLGTVLDDPAGPLFAGDPLITDSSYVAGARSRSGHGTYYGGPSLCGGTTGYLTGDGFWVAGPNGLLDTCVSLSGSYSQSGQGACDPSLGVWDAFYLRLWGSPTSQCVPAIPIGVPECDGEFNSTGERGQIHAYGSLDPDDDNLTLVASELPQHVLGIFITAQQSDFILSGSGNLCLDPPTLGRWQAPKDIRMTGVEGMATLSTCFGGINLDAIPLPFVSYPAVFGFTSHFQFWHRDRVGGVNTWNFTGSTSVTWN